MHKYERLGIPTRSARELGRSKGEGEGKREKERKGGKYLCMRTDFLEYLILALLHCVMSLALPK